MQTSLDDKRTAQKSIRESQIPTPYMECARIGWVTASPSDGTGAAALRIQSTSPLKQRDEDEGVYPLERLRSHLEPEIMG